MYKNKISAVYQIINEVTGDRYVGSSRNVRDRWHEHKCTYKQKRYPNNQMYKDMQELGVDKFRFQILAPVEPEHLKQVEQEFIDMLHPTYNIMRAYGVDEERTKARSHLLCEYNGEILTLKALESRFRRAGMTHVRQEAKKYLIQ